MSIFEDRDWSKSEILEVFGSRTKLDILHQQSYHTSNGEIEFNGNWYYYLELKELLRIFDKQD